MIRAETRTVHPSDARPEGKPDACYFCDSEVGSEHESDCAKRVRTVVVDFTVRMVMEVPESWSTEDVESHYMDERCSNHLLGDLLSLHDDDHACLCGRTTAAYVGEATRADESTYTVIPMDLCPDCEGSGEDE